MGKWNKIGYFKAIIVALAAIMNIYVPLEQEPEVGFAALTLPPFLMGVIGIPFIFRNDVDASTKQRMKPTWNDSIFRIKRPLSTVSFGGYFFLFVGFSSLIGAALKSQEIHKISLSVMMFGVGILIGVWIVFKRKK